MDVKTNLKVAGAADRCSLCESEFSDKNPCKFIGKPAPAGLLGYCLWCYRMNAEERGRAIISFAQLALAKADHARLVSNLQIQALQRERLGSHGRAAPAPRGLGSPQ
ncbi:MAG TPA: hypothetical protein VM285_14555 [Polyangia bacterium]|nr:hypothetical protein [Polyangia bacterium]